MIWPFYVCSAVALWSCWRVISNSHPVHGLLNLIVSLLAVAGIFFTLGAPFAAALEMIVYAGAILVLFVFVVMMLNLGSDAQAQEKRWLNSATWAMPMAMTVILGLALVWMLGSDHSHAAELPLGTQTVGAKAVGISLFGPYLLLVELASMLLLGALVAAYHLGKKPVAEAEREVAQRQAELKIQVPVKMEDAP